MIVMCRLEELVRVGEVGSEAHCVTCERVNELTAERGSMAPGSKQAKEVRDAFSASIFDLQRLQRNGTES